MDEYDAVIEMLSEKRAGSKLKRITKRDLSTPRLSEITLYFEDERNKGDERVIGIAGKDLQVFSGHIGNPAPHI